MEQLNNLRRQSVDLWQAAQKNLASMQQLSLESFRRQPHQEGMRGTWERIDLPPLPRSSHSLDIISGSAYVFGGEVNPREPVDNDMLVIRLPFSSAGADCFKIPAKADLSFNATVVEPAATAPAVVPTIAPPKAPENAKQKESKDKDLEDVPLDSKPTPPPKKKDDSDDSDDSDEEDDSEEDSDDDDDDDDEDESESESEAKPTAKTAAKTTATPADKGKQRAVDEKPAPAVVPAPRVGHATASIGARIFLFGGRGGPDMKPMDEGGRVWVFDTRTRLWAHLDPVPAVKGGSIVPHPAPRSYHCATATDRPRDFAPPPPKKAETWQEWALGDTSKTGIPQDPIVGHIAEDAVDEEDIGYGTFFVHAGCLANGDRTSDIWAFDILSRTWTELPAAPGPARGGSSICVSKSRLFRFGGFDGQKELGGQLDFLHLEVEMFDDNITRGEINVRAHGGWQSILESDPDASSTEIPSEPAQAWPAPRSVSSLEAITIGGGTEYLVLTMGEGSPSGEGHASAGKFLNDVWLFQVPPLGMTAASVTAAMLQAVGRKTGEGKWTKVTMGPYDEEILEMPRARGWLASAPMTDLEETGIVIFGGLDDNNRRRGEGWILRLA